MRTMDVLARLAATSLLAASLGASAAAGDFDASFGTGGVVLGAVGTDSNEGLVIDRLEGIVFIKSVDSGPSRIVSLRRLRANGTLDTGFGVGGEATLVTYPAGQFATTNLAPDGRRLVGVSRSDTEVTVRRFSESGVLDAGFGAGGVATLTDTYGLAIIGAAVQPDSKVLVVTTVLDLVVGSQQIVLYRLTAAGALDATFGTGGVVKTAIAGRAGNDRGTGLALQADGKIVVFGRSQNTGGGTDPIVLRYLANGSLDATFASGGVAVVPFAGEPNVIARRGFITSDGKITAIGTIVAPPPDLAKGVAALRLNADGSVDVTFGTNGRAAALTNRASGLNVARQTDDKFLIAGFYQDLAGGGPLHRLTPFGTRDAAWDGDGLLNVVIAGFANTNLGDVAIDSHDRIVVVGDVSTLPDFSDSRWFVARLDAGRMVTCR